MNPLRLAMFYFRVYIVSPMALLFMGKVVCPGCGSLQNNYFGEYFKCHNPNCGLHNIRVYPNGEVSQE